MEKDAVVAARDFGFDETGQRSHRGNFIGGFFELRAVGFPCRSQSFEGIVKNIDVTRKSQAIESFVEGRAASDVALPGVLSALGQ